MTTTDEALEWLQWRRTGIGGTDVARILGMSRYGSPHDVWREKILTPVQTTPAPDMQAGIDLEELILNKFIKRHSYEPGVMYHAMRATREEIFIASLDGLYVVDSDVNPNQNKIIVEAKAPRWWRARTWETSHELPIEWLMQVQHYMYVLDCERAVIAMLTDDCRVYREFVVDKIDYENLFVPALAAWWDVQIVKGQEPAQNTPLEALAATGEGLLEAGEEEMDMIRKFNSNKLLIGKLEQVQTTLKDQLQQALRACGGSVITHEGLARVTWNSHEVTRVDLKKLRSSYADVAAACEVTTTEKKFVVKDFSNDENT